MSKEARLTRREFLKFSGVAGVSIFLRPELGGKEEINLVLNERVSEIVSLIEPLGINSMGDLIHLKQGKNGVDGRVSLLPTHRNEVERNPMEEVKLLIVHYDAGERYRQSGVERNAANTVNGLNGNDPDGNGLGPSVHWCVDNFTIARNDTGEGGYGILQTQVASGDALRPYRGHHVYISPEHPEIDPNRERTARRFTDQDIYSNLNPLVERGVTDFNAYALGYEQIGTHFEERFPSDWEPPRQQMANTLSLCIAVMKQYQLSPWDILGHHEVQQKSDPGDYHMATLRFLLGVAALTGKIQADIVFRGENPRSYFRKIEQYLSIVDRYGRLHAWKSFMGYENFIESLPRSVPVRHQRGFPHGNF